MKRTASPPRTSRRRLWAAIPVAACMALLLAVPAAASTVQIDDEANVLNVTAVQNEAATLPVPIYIWTTTQDAANKSVFDNDVRQKVSSQFPIVLGINTAAHHETLQIGSASGFTQDTARAAESSANSAFDSVMRSRNDYTAAVLAALTSLRTSLANRGNTGQPAGAASRSHGPGLVIGIVVLIVLVVVIALLGRLFRGYRRTQRMSGPPMGYGGGYGGGGYGGGGYGPPPPGYGQGYGGYGPGYGGGYGGGMGRGAAAGLGAVGGGLLGYELGKMEGENEQFRRDETYGNQDQNYGDQGGGGGDWTVGQDSDWGGGGGDSGGGDPGGGGGDW